MSSPDLEKHPGRTFSFHPPILNIEHNEWIYMKGSWSEILVQNTETGMDLWIPQRFIGEISGLDDPIMTAALTQELEYKGGTVWPLQRSVVDMPPASKPGPAAPKQADTVSTPPKSRESAAERKITNLILRSLAVAIVATIVLVALYRGYTSGGRINYIAILQVELGLNYSDDYYAVVRKLGTPKNSRWKAETGERQYRALDYPDLKLTVILMGVDRDQVFYIGAKDENWANVHTVELPGGVNTDSLLRSLEPF